jgi:type IV fimbrial biogenesis protein FimT
VAVHLSFDQTSTTADLAMHPNKRVHGGFTLIELVILMVAIALMATIAIPSFDSSVSRNSIDAAQSELQAALNLARSEAVKRGKTVTLCASSDQQVCSNVWSSGWLLFVDNNSNNAVNSGEEILRVGRAVNGRNGLAMSGSVSNNAIQFKSSGFSNQNSTWTYCAADKALSKARGIVVESSGLTRRSRDTNGDGVQEGFSAALACP